VSNQKRTYAVLALDRRYLNSQEWKSLIVIVEMTSFKTLNKSRFISDSAKIVFY